MAAYFFEENSKQAKQARYQQLIPYRQKSKVDVNQNITKLLMPGLARCLISWILIGGFYASVWGYKDRVLSPRTKSLFDAITVALSIAFGLNIASSLKAIALDLRWWVLSIKRRSSQEVSSTLQPREDG